MSKQEYNWAKEKKAFFASDIDEVKSYFIDKYGVYTSTITDNTTGWSKEKKAYQQDIAEQAIKKAGEKLADRYAEGLEAITEKFINMATKETGELDDEQDARELKIVFDVMRTINGKVISIKENQIKDIDGTLGTPINIILKK